VIIANQYGKLVLQKTNFQKIQEQKLILFSLAAIGFAIIGANLFGEDVSIVFTDWFYMPVIGTLVVLSIIMAARSRLVGDHGKAWVLFACMTVCWFMAELAWLVYELFLEIDPYPSEADFFWLAGYPLYFGFLVFYLRPLRKAITKKSVVTAVIISALLLVPSLYIAYDVESELSDLEFALGLTYPIASSAVLVPAIVGVILFYRGEVNFLWTLMCIAIFFDIVADAGFLFTTLEDSYYSGHPIEILYLWAYALFAFGVYYHIKLFSVSKKTIDLGK